MDKTGPRIKSILSDGGFPGIGFYRISIIRRSTGKGVGMNSILIGIRYGLCLSATLGLVVLGSQWWDAEMWIDDYPPTIRKRFGEISSGSRRRKGLVTLLFAAVFISWVVLSLIHMGPDRSFVDSFVVVFIVITVFNLFDLLVLDWLVFVTITPGFIVLPGTEGMDEYHSMSFHVRGFVKGCLIAIILGLLSATAVIVFS